MNPERQQSVRAIACAIGGAMPALKAGDVDVAIAEGVAPLLAATPAAGTLDAAARERLLAQVRASAIHAAALDDELRRLLPALQQRGCVLVIKGAHLAHTVYSMPSLRPRDDSDLLIAVRDRSAIAAALADAGYAPAALTSGSLILGQFLYQRALGPGVAHYVDVHWRAAAPLVFADAFDVAAMAAAGEPVPGLGPAARGPALHDALSLACVHVVAHHWPGASLRWLYDLRLLAAALDDPARERFARSASARRYRSIAIGALARAREVFPSPSLDAAIGALQRMPAVREPSAALIRPGRLPVNDFLLDLKTAGWRRGATLVREHLLPPPAYMRMAFAGRPLPIAYAARLIRAVRKRLV
jgi:Uncharacterised nucleotidyltransferase